MRTREILDSLKPLFERAERENLWFFSQYFQLWLSPAELRARQEKGQYVWGDKSWTLEDPLEKLEDLDQDAKEALAAYEEFKERVNTWKETTASTP